MENSYGNENSYPVQNFNYGLNSFGTTDDLIEIPPDPFSHQSYSRRIDSLALDALDIGGRLNGVQVTISEDLLKDYYNFLSKCFQIRYSDYIAFFGQNANTFRFDGSSLSSEEH